MEIRQDFKDIVDGILSGNITFAQASFAIYDYIWREDVAELIASDDEKRLFYFVDVKAGYLDGAKPKASDIEELKQLIG